MAHDGMRRLQKGASHRAQLRSICTPPVRDCDEAVAAEEMQHAEQAERESLLGARYSAPHIFRVRYGCARHLQTEQVFSCTCQASRPAGFDPARARKLAKAAMTLRESPLESEIHNLGGPRQPVMSSRASRRELSFTVFSAIIFFRRRGFGAAWQTREVSPLRGRLETPNPKYLNRSLAKELGREPGRHSAHEEKHPHQSARHRHSDHTSRTQDRTGFAELGVRLSGCDGIADVILPASEYS